MQSTISLKNCRRTVYMCVGGTFERKKMLLCSTVLARVARCTTQMLVPGCISLVLELTPRKIVPLQMLVARLALQLHLAFSTCVGCASERVNILFCFAPLASVARGAAQVLLPAGLSSVLKLSRWKRRVGANVSRTSRA